VEETKRHRGGDKRSSWLTFQRRLFLVRQLIRGPALASVLISKANAAFPGVPDGIYAGDVAAALRHDLAALRREFGCAIHYQPGVGYLLDHPGQLALIDLPDEELDALAFLLNNLAASALPNAPHVSALLGRVIALLPEERRHALEASATHPRLDSPKPLAGPDADILRRLTDALGRHEVSFMYHSPLNPGLSEHRAAPYDLTYRDGFTYLEAFCLECRDETAPLERRYVFYRLDRIVPGTFRRLPRRLPPGRPPRQRYRIRYRLAPDLARRHDFAVWFADTTVSFTPDGAAIVEGQTTDLWLARQILMRYREHCRVLEPPELVEMMRTSVELMAQSYTMPAELEDLK
jgi:predicted DNA-binding transcriptional regulator YafY